MKFIQILTLSVPGPFLAIFTTLKKLDVIQPKKPKTIQQHTKWKMNSLPICQLKSFLHSIEMVKVVASK